MTLTAASWRSKKVWNDLFVPDAGDRIVIPAGVPQVRIDRLTPNSPTRVGYEELRVNRYYQYGKLVHTDGIPKTEKWKEFRSTLNLDGHKWLARAADVMKSFAQSDWTSLHKTKLLVTKEQQRLKRFVQRQRARFDREYERFVEKQLHLKEKFGKRYRPTNFRFKAKAYKYRWINLATGLNCCSAFRPNVANVIPNPCRHLKVSKGNGVISLDSFGGTERWEGRKVGYTGETRETRLKSSTSNFGFDDSFTSELEDWTKIYGELSDKDKSSLAAQLQPTIKRIWSIPMMAVNVVESVLLLGQVKVLLKTLHAAATQKRFLTFSFRKNALKKLMRNKKGALRSIMNATRVEFKSARDALRFLGNQDLAYRFGVKAPLHDLKKALTDFFSQHSEFRRLYDRIWKMQRTDVYHANITIPVSSITSLAPGSMANNFPHGKIDPPDSGRICGVGAMKGWDGRTIFSPPSSYDLEEAVAGVRRYTLSVYMSYDLVDDEGRTISETDLAKGLFFGAYGLDAGGFLEAIWDIVPYSFIMDWFTNIVTRYIDVLGQRLSRFHYVPRIRYATISRRSVYRKSRTFVPRVYDQSGEDFYPYSSSPKLTRMRANARFTSGASLRVDDYSRAIIPAESVESVLRPEVPVRFGLPRGIQNLIGIELLLQKLK